MTISWPSAAAASSRQELTGRPSSSTAQAPQAPSPQASFVPRSSRSSRRTSSSRRPSALDRVALTVDVEGDRHPLGLQARACARQAGYDPRGAPSRRRFLLLAVARSSRPAAGLVGRERRHDDRGDDDGGDHDDRSSASGGCTDVEAPAARKDGGAKAPKQRLDPEKTYKLVFKTNCGSFTVTLDLELSAGDRRVARLAREGGLLRRHRLPPDRAGLRDPGRRPDADRHGRPRLQDGRPACRPARAT